MEYFIIDPTKQEATMLTERGSRIDLIYAIQKELGSDNFEAILTLPNSDHVYMPSICPDDARFYWRAPFTNTWMIGKAAIVGQGNAPKTNLRELNAMLDYTKNSYAHGGDADRSNILNRAGFVGGSDT